MFYREAHWYKSERNNDNNREQFLKIHSSFWYKKINPLTCLWKWSLKVELKNIKIEVKSEIQAQNQAHYRKPQQRAAGVQPSWNPGVPFRWAVSAKKRKWVESWLSAGSRLLYFFLHQCLYTLKPIIL